LIVNVTSFETAGPPIASTRTLRVDEPATFEKAGYSDMNYMLSAPAPARATFESQ
jgi:hypothetical protein